MKFKSILLLLLFISGMTVYGQETPYIEGDLLVMLYDNGDLSAFTQNNQEVDGISIDLKEAKVLSELSAIYLFTFDVNSIDDKIILNKIKQDPRVRAAQFNHTVTERLIPNDTNFGSQWHHVDDSDNDIDSDLAWNTTTGGTTANGDQIVVCVIEGGGSNYQHADLISNHWVNTGEIDGNGIDDDGNGYVDDYNGWNSGSGNDNIGNSSHGTSVSGMIGAQGNNSSGGSGVNWNIGIMQVDRGGLSESSVIASYNYPYIMRNNYNNSGGANGAFVVATNASWGIDNADPANYPIWCAYYDDLGAVGILNCGATTNNNVNVDVVGDMPTGCSSNYMISVTATNDNDVRTFSGYGATTIDLGAPGSATYLPNSTGVGSTGHSSPSGTSFASPCVAGAIGLIYSAPCTYFASDALTNPQGTANLIRGYILNGVDPVPNLAGECATGGRLNVNNSLNLLINDCAVNCMNPWASNYNPAANIHEDLACSYTFGCTDPTACNFEFSATYNNGTCAYQIHECLDFCIDDFNRGVGFTGNYTTFFWAQDFGTGDGTISHTPGALHIIGNNNNDDNVLTQSSILAIASGVFSFEWCYFSFDGPSYDIAYYVNGIRTDLTDTSLGGIQNGSLSIFVNAGDEIAFGIESTDGCCGNGQLTITNFTWPLDTSDCGCDDPWACNYDSSTITHDPTLCNYSGCTDSNACNYDFQAGCDNGSCNYLMDSCNDYCYDSTTGNGVDFRFDYWPFLWTDTFGGGEGEVIHNNSWMQIIGNNNNNVSSAMTQATITATATGTFTFDWSYFTSDPDGPNFDPAYFINGIIVDLSDNLGSDAQNGSVTFTANAGDLIGFGVLSSDGCCGEATLVITNFQWPINTDGCGCSDPLACNYDDNISNHDPSLCAYGGCTDFDACNYAFFATCDDGSCEYQTDACFEYCYDPFTGNAVGFANGYWPFLWTQDFDGADGAITHLPGYLQIIGNNNTIYNNTTTQTTITALYTGVFSFKWNYFTTDGPSFDPAVYINGVVTQISNNGGGNSQSGFITFFANAGDLIGFGVTSTDGCCGEATLVISDFSWPLDTSGCGCTDPWACNYDSTATFYEDGSCDYNTGCTDNTACNFDFAASCDDGTCIYETNECTGDCVNASGNGVGFFSLYWPFYWTQDIGTGNGTISHTNGSIHIIGNDNGSSLSSDILTQTTYTAQATGEYSFDWCYFATDGPNYDPAYYINGVEVELTDPLGAFIQNGSITFTATAGDVIGWGINSLDGCCGEGHLTINNFIWPLDNTGCGCMDPWASNYDSTASFQNYDDCEYLHGCTDATACNYDSTASIDTGSCVFDSSNCTADCINGLGDGIDFNAYYAPGNWTYNYGTGNGEITQTIGSLHILGNNDSGSLDSNVLTEATIVANQTGVYTFDWCYFTTDGPLYDIAYFVNGIRVDLTDTALANSQNGSVSFFANAGDEIAFGIDSTDGCCGYGLLTVSNFTYPSQECCCPGDANNDFVVNVLDLIAVSSNFGCTTGCPFGDADCNGQVTILDLLAVSSNFGAVCP